MTRTQLLLKLTVGIGCLLWVSLIPSAWGKGPLKVVVSIVPQKYFVEQIGGDRVDVSVMVLPGASPATYEPKPQQMVGLTKSKIYFAIGVPFEETWLKKFTSMKPKIMIVHTEGGIEKIPMEGHHHFHEQGHHEDNGQQHHYGRRDPHIWLSPPLVMLQSRNILDALTEIDPANRGLYAANYSAFIRELVDLDLKIREVFAGKGGGAEFMVYHPAWGYFAESYGLKQIPIELEGKEPTAKGLQGLIQHAKEEGVKVIFIQPQFSKKSADTIAEAIGGHVMFADPLELDWANNLLKVAEGFENALE
jgi:zinc transport system substrate-binding protein